MATGTPLDSRRETRAADTADLVACLGLLVAWAACLYFVPLGIPLLLVAIFWLVFRGEREKAAAFTLISPYAVVPLVSVAAATYAYAFGPAEVLTSGLSFYERGTPDEETGLPMRRTGCVLTGMEVLHNGPNNLTLRLLTSLFGKKKHVFTPLMAQELRRAAEVWRGAHPTGCPTLQVLIEDHAIDDATAVVDPWGQPLRVRCEDDETSVLSRGPDRIEGTSDDIAVPRRE